MELKGKRETHPKEVRFKLSEDLHQSLRRVSADLKCSLQDLAEMSIRELVACHEKTKAISCASQKDP
jgi:hypothetical protein